jgi:LAO/AO transport system kinase
LNTSAKAILDGNRRALAKAITLIESHLPEHIEQGQQLLDQLLPHTGNSVRIGISGIPGVGKSTFIEAFGLYLISLGKRVAVLAVDPSSPLAGGSILGDKTRMEYLAREEKAFIRPSPTSGSLGGVANKTRESILLVEAAGYDVVLVETVGVGQSEYEVAGMVDFFTVLMLPNAGDELQGIKKGILELADSLLVNKSDGESVQLAQMTKRHYENAFHLLRQNSFWTPQVMPISALENNNIEAVWGMVIDYVSQAKEQGSFTTKRAQQNRNWLDKLIHELLEQILMQNDSAQALWPRLELDVVNGKMTPFAAAKAIIKTL